MQFIVHYTVDAGQRDAAQTRFTETGAPPPSGVTMSGRWHCVQGGEGFLICEADDASAMATWIQQWSDVMRFRVLPVLDDQTMAKVIS